MTDDLNTLVMTHPQPPGRPLLGLTVLLVEDSRFASDAVRLLCLRSGARIRRADCLASARKHLRVYRPAVAIIDLGLPDGLGDELIAELATAQPRVSVILATSGDDGAQARAMAAGADGFLPKPIANLAAFQQAILAQLSDPDRSSLRALTDEEIQPDPIALRDDLMHVADVLAANEDRATLDYVAQFLGGLARSANDRPLAQAARGLSHPGARDAALSQINGLVQKRLAAPVRM